MTNESKQAEDQLVALAPRLKEAEQEEVEAKNAYDEAFEPWQTSHQHLIYAKKQAAEQKRKLREQAYDLIRKLYDLNGTIKTRDCFSAQTERAPVFNESELQRWCIQNIPGIATQFMRFDTDALEKFIADNSTKDEDGEYHLTPALQNMPVKMGKRIKKTVVHWSKLPDGQPQSDAASVSRPLQGCPEWIQEQKEGAAAWARNLLKEPFVVLDFETTGVDGEPVQIAVVDHKGQQLMNTLVKPKTYEIEKGAQAVHGISAEKVKDCPTFKDLYEQFVGLLAGKTVVAYNAAFERKILKYTAGLYDLEKPEKVDWQCAMLQYARFFGDWQEGWKQSFAWQKLSAACEHEGVVVDGKAHDALVDVQLTLGLIRKMAQYIPTPF